MSIIIYGIYVSFFTSTVHVDVDEELYIGLARSFHYQGRFKMGGQLLNYSCVLYSMLISVAYFFYSPEHILFFMRLIGVLVMCSAIFPIWLLAVRILGDNKKAFSITAFMLFMPYMLDCGYLMQEVLAYPLFLWTVYLGYCCMGEKNKNDYHLYLCASLSAACYFTKTYLFFIPIVVNIYSLYGFLKEKNKRKVILKKTIKYDVVYLLMVGMMYFMIYVINGWESGVNHYATQFSHLFPITVKTIIYGGIACIIYTALLVFNTGVFPMFSLIGNKEKVFGEKRKLLEITFISVVVLVVEIIFLIVLTEEGLQPIPHKFLFRYFHIFVPILFIYFINFINENDYMGKKWFAFGILMCASIITVYFFYLDGNTRQAIIDGHLFLVLENATKYLFRYADVIIILLLCCLVFLYCITSLKRKRNVVSGMMKMAIIATLVFFIVDGMQLPIYNNMIAKGEIIQTDGIKIAHYLNLYNYDYVYYIDTEQREDYYYRNFYGYIMQSYEVVTKEEMWKIDTSKNKTAIVSPNPKIEIAGMGKREIGTDKLALYVETVEE